MGAQSSRLHRLGWNVESAYSASGWIEWTMRVAALVAGLLFCLGAVLDAFQTIICHAAPPAASALPVSSTSPPGRPGRPSRGISAIPRCANSVTAPSARARCCCCSCSGAAVGHRFRIALFRTAHTLRRCHGRRLRTRRLRTDLYVSGTTLFTLGIGDVLPRSLAARASSSSSPAPAWDLSPSSSATSLCSTTPSPAARSQSRCSTAALDRPHLHRTAAPPRLPRRTGGLVVLLVEWERWSAEILETHVSYPILCYYAPSTTTRAGSPPSPPCSTPAPCSSRWCRTSPPARRSSPSPWPATRSSTSATSSAWKSVGRSGSTRRPRPPA